MEKKQRKHARSRSFTGAGLASFFRSTVASFSSTFPSRGRSSFNHRNAFSGPIVSIVPPEARGGSRRKPRSGYRTPEPSSPKVSCIGQIKRSGSRRQKKVNPCGKNGGACPLPPRHPAAEGTTTKPCGRPRGSLVKRMSFFRRSRSRSRSRSSSSSKDGFCNGTSCAFPAAAAPAPAPAGLGQMKRFTSGRAAFQDFDWREEEERRSRDSDEEEEDEGFVAYSAPLTLGGGVVASEPRKEVNLWRRRPMAPPTPLQLH
ncbi:hypothetical protein SEVIR_2G304300v4 [Setaria viridis]|uniref:Syringolide-induced protein 14-1-1 n=1 Tax=Setaria viridis TaxID=4556 RepID=A0A4U6W9P3_SETVI|nr:uncharacterized protein At1g76070-like [Setaria viridis]TKW34387.1 hypothetical protein SEVIR_2G304300v2 [Setaria viridis]